MNGEIDLITSQRKCTFILGRGVLQPIVRSQRLPLLKLKGTLLPFFSSSFVVAGLLSNFLGGQCNIFVSEVSISFWK